MSDICCPPPPSSGGPSFRRALWVALVANAAMFLVEVAASASSGSSALAADAVDFLGDSANYAVALGALALGGIWTSRAALAKALAMGAFGVGVIGYVLWRAWVGAPPEAVTMGAVALLAFTVNLGVTLLLYRYREGDANMRSVWLCTRNDVIGNIAVMLAAAGVAGSGTVWPDVAVAGLMAVLALGSARIVLRQSLAELATR
jgi:Co/Zn/Cd efflux system component